MNDRVLVTINNHVAEVVLNRPEKMNAFDQAGFEQLVAAAEIIRNDNSVRAVLLRAEGDHFCAGADKAFLQGAVADSENFAARALTLDEGDTANAFQKPAMVWYELDVPVVVCLQGVVYGAGMQVALAGDIRIASATTAMSLFEINWGLIPDMGVTQTLPRLVRSDIAAELVLTGRVVKAQEALDIGLITRLCANPAHAGLELAVQIAARSPDATRRGKRLMRDSAKMSLKQGLAFEALLQSELVGTPNQIEAAMANVQKRQATFS